MDRKWLVAGVVVASLAVWWFYPSRPAGPVNAASGNVCIDRHIDVQAIIAGWTDRGVVRATFLHRGAMTVDVDSGKWAAIAHDDQLAIATAAYCLAADSAGSGTAEIRGSGQEALGSVSDGNWAP